MNSKTCKDVSSHGRDSGCCRHLIAIFTRLSRAEG